MASLSYLETAFNVMSFAPGPFWLALLFFPDNRWAMRAFDIFLFLLSLHFAILTVPGVPELLPVIANPTLEAIRNFLSTPQGTLGSWNHMILADLWIGRWVARDTLNRKLGVIVRLVFIPVILFFGPLGLCFYLIFRAIAYREIWLEQRAI